MTTENIKLKNAYNVYALEHFEKPSNKENYSFIESLCSVTPMQYFLFNFTQKVYSDIEYARKYDLEDSYYNWYKNLEFVKEQYIKWSIDTFKGIGYAGNLQEKVEEESEYLFATETWILNKDPYSPQKLLKDLKCFNNYNKL